MTGSPGNKGHLIADLPDLGVHVVGGTFPGVVHDVEHRDTGRPRAGEQARRLGQGGFGAFQLHDALLVGVLVSRS